jgi:hypothetical protein
MRVVFDNAGNTLALFTAATALALGIWDRVNKRKDSADNAESKFRDSLMQRLSTVEQEKAELEEKYEGALRECYENGALLTSYKHCIKPDCPFKAHIVIDKSKDK